MEFTPYLIRGGNDGLRNNIKKCWTHYISYFDFLLFVFCSESQRSLSHLFAVMRADLGAVFDIIGISFEIWILKFGTIFYLRRYIS